VPSDRTRDVECYKCGGRGHLKLDCPNIKKVYFSSLKHDYESQDESVAESNPSSDETDLACGPDLADNVPKLNFVARRALSVKMSPNDQREQLFHTRAIMRDISLSVIIDSGSCANFISEKVVNHFKLKMSDHPTPYQLQWISSKGGKWVKFQALINFSIGAYKDEILCDVTDMDATHLMLGRPWQYDRRTIHDGFLNTYLFK